jgi:hypothetical protein
MFMRQGVLYLLTDEKIVGHDSGKSPYLRFSRAYYRMYRYLAVITFTGDRAANLDLCLALTASISEGSFTCLTDGDMGPPFKTSYLKDPYNSQI